MLKFTTKSDTLENLRKVIKKAKVLKQVSISLFEYNKENDKIIELLKKNNMIDDVLIIRSSSKNEDNTETSNAGKFLSIGNVKGIENIKKAVKEVAKSIDDDLENRIFIQPYLQNVKICGVLFTVDPNTGGNYYVINYDESGLTDSVTSGTKNDLKMYYHFKDSKFKPIEPLDKLIEASIEIEKIFKNNYIDIEFAFCQKESVKNEQNVNDYELYILQVRPLVLKIEISDLEEQTKILSEVYKKIENNMKRHPSLFGEKTIYGVMPDWNPAEMIGTKPKQLALSLYKEIITNGVWAYQRDNYGYLNLRSFPLMVDFAGLPYIDTRISFNSFLPKGLSNELSEKLINYYINKLYENPNLHDKVEFSIAFTSYTFDLDERIKILNNNGFYDDEIEDIKNKLKLVTNKIINSKTGLWRKDRQKIDILKEKHKEILLSDLNVLDKIYWLLEYCKRYGTLPFAGLARAGFVAVEFLKSLVNVNIITEDEKSQYMNTLSTVGKNISSDFINLSKQSFLKKYGHLRPGTYDITSKRYDMAGDSYFNFENKMEVVLNEEEFKLSLEQYKKIQDLLDEKGLNVSVLELFDFIKQAIEGREYSKFVFTNILSDVLEMIQYLGKNYGFSREDMAYLNINVLMDNYTQSNFLKENIENSIKQGKKIEKISKSLIMPPVIKDITEVYTFFMPDSEANFITQKIVMNEVVVLPSEENLEGKIVLIKSADPGFDWIFSKKIKGFITAFGGANSHMAIRSAEFMIPAVIGVGEKAFDQYKMAKIIKIDCLNKKVEIIK